MNERKEIADEKKINVAIDGFSSSGKSTMARELAKRVNYIYIDSGAMYRAVTLYALRHGMMLPGGKPDVDSLTKALPEIKIAFAPCRSAEGVQHTLLNGVDVEEEIRDMEVSANVSPIAEIASVRQHLVKLQQEFGKAKGVVMDGRDIGTTVFPDAELKVFVTAGVHERAKRRWRELEQKGEDVRFEDVLANLEERDRIDTTREVSPLRQAPDALVLDNGAVTHEEQMDWIMNAFRDAVKRNESRD